MPNKVTVLYLDHTAKWSGGEIALLRMLEAIDRTRVRPIVVLAEDGPFVEHLQQAQIETHILPLADHIREVRKDSLTGGGLVKQLGTAWHLLRYASRLAKFARSCGATIIHTNSLKSDMYGGLAGRLARIPVIWHIRDHIAPPYLPLPTVRLFRKMAKHIPQHIITNSQSTLDTLFVLENNSKAVIGEERSDSNLLSRSTVVHDGLNLPSDAEDGAEATRDDHAFHQPPRIGIVGRITPWKGQHIFLEAARQVKAQGFNAHWQIIGAPLFGEEAYEQELRTLATNLGIADSVEFTGFQKDVPAVLRQLDILIHASTTPEPFGQVVTEGMAAGLPVVATNGGGVREIIQDGVNGLLVPMGDPVALSHSVMRLLQDPVSARAMARAGYRHIRQNFTATQTARKVEAVYDVVTTAYYSSGTRPLTKTS